MWRRKLEEGERLLHLTRHILVYFFQGEAGRQAVPSLSILKMVIKATQKINVLLGAIELSNIINNKCEDKAMSN